LQQRCRRGDYNNNNTTVGISRTTATTKTTVQIVSGMLRDLGCKLNEIKDSTYFTTTNLRNFSLLRI